jgi:predicted helicase
MRASLLNTFDDIYILNLNGSTKRRDKALDGTLDQNVFDIQQGVAIALFIRRGDELADGSKRTRYYSLRGPRRTNEETNTIGKYEWLDAHSVTNTEWQLVDPVAPYYLFVPRDKEIEAEYKKGVSLKDVFLVSGVGIVAGRDHFNFAFTAQEMEDRLVEFASMDLEEARIRFDLGKDSTAWSARRAQDEVNSQRRIHELTVPVLYRPFDKRYTYYTGNSHGFLARPTHKVNQHMTLGPNLAICTARSVEVASGWNHVLAVNTMIQHHVVSTKEVNHLFPLRVYHNNLGAVDGHHNLNPAVVSAFSERLGLPFRPGASQEGDVFGERDLFCFALAILHSDEYRQRYAEPLRDDFACIPLIGTPELFWAMVEKGAEICELHTSFGSREGESTFPAQGSNEIIKRQFAVDAEGRLWINDEQYFTGVDEAVDSYSVGGIRVLSQWLSDRRGRKLSTDDVDAFRSIVSTVARLVDIPSEVDEIIEDHGGWPLL